MLHGLVYFSDAKGGGVILQRILHTFLHIENILEHYCKEASKCKSVSCIPLLSLWPVSICFGGQVLDPKPLMILRFCDWSSRFQINKSKWKPKQLAIETSALSMGFTSAADRVRCSRWVGNAAIQRVVQYQIWLPNLDWLYYKKPPPSLNLRWKHQQDKIFMGEGPRQSLHYGISHFLCGKMMSRSIT